MNTEEKVIEEMVKKAALALGEHVESVRIFVTYQTTDGERNTAGFNFGCGNYYAQCGQVYEWLETQRQYTRNYANKQQDS